MLSPRQEGAKRDLIDADALLLRRYRASGEREAFEALFRKYQAPIYGLVVRLVGQQDAYDLTQDIFLKALRSLNSFRGDCSFRTWLYMIARHICYNHCRDEKRRHTIEGFFGGDCDDESGVSHEEQVPDPEMNVARIVETQELQRIVTSILEKMSLEQRMLITLRDFEGMSYEEISQISELSPVNVKSKLHRARMAFKMRFEPYWKALNGEEGVSVLGQGAATPNGHKATGGPVEMPGDPPKTGRR